MSDKSFGQNYWSDYVHFQNFHELSNFESNDHSVL